MAEIVNQDKQNAPLFETADNVNADEGVEVGASNNGWQLWPFGNLKIQYDTQTPVSVDKIMYLRPRDSEVDPNRRWYCVWLKGNNDLDEPGSAKVSISGNNGGTGTGISRDLTSTKKLQRGVFIGRGPHI